VFTNNRAVRIVAFFSLIVVMLWGYQAQAQAGAQARIVSQINDEERITVPSTTPALVKRSVDSGRVAGGEKLGRMLLLLAPTSKQEQEAARFVAAQHDSSSPLFHKWLTPAKYGERFGVATEDAQKVQQWLQSQGLTVHEVSQSRRFISFSGTVSQVEQAFSTQMHSYTFNNQKFIANSTDIRIPAALSPVVKGVVRLHSDPHPSALKIGDKINVDKKTGKIEGPYGLHFLGPADFATIYNVQPLYDSGINGAGQTIAIVSRSSLVDTNLGVDGLQDIRDFRNVMGLPANDPEIIVNGDDPLVLSYQDTLEAMLDVTWAGAVAPMAHIIAVASQSNFADGIDASAVYIVDHNLAPIMSTSFGSCEQNLGPVQNAFYNALWQQAAAQGITAFVSAGDNGGAGCDDPGSGYFASNGLAVSGIASTPYSVAVGGTQFDDTANPDAYWSITSDPTNFKSALSYIPEKVWNESSNDPFFTSLWAGGGGVSTIYAKPDWQTASGVPNDGKRDLPDISLAAAGHTGYAVCFLSSCSSPDYVGLYTFGGTSASSPAAAGIMALVLQKMGGQPQGVANYVFYKLASTSGVYHDITTGENKVPDSNGQYTVGYDAGPGYDLASGLGSFDANALVNNWAAASASASATTALSLANGQATNVVHGTPVSFQVSVTCTGAGCTAPTGDVALQGTSGGNFAGLGAVQLNPGAPSSIATATTSTIPGGTYGVSARYSGDGLYHSSSSNPINITVTPEPSQMAMGGVSGGWFITAPLSLSYAEPVTLYVAVAGKSGNGHPTGQISLLVDGTPPTTVGRDFQTPSTLTLNYGENANFFGTGVSVTGQSSVLPNLSSGFAAGTHQVQASYPGDNSFSAAHTAYSFTVAKEDSIIADFFPIGTVIANVPVTLAGQIVLANNGCAPYGGTVTITDYTPNPPVVLGSAPASQLYCDSYSVPVTFTTGGNHLLRVSFSGDSNVNASYDTYTLPVSSSTYSYVSLSSDVSSAIIGSPVTLSAQVGSDVRQYTATGTMTFLDGTTTIGTAQLDATGTATLIVSSLAAGAHNISSNYSGDAVLQASSGGPMVVTVADYTMQAQPASLTIVVGQSGTTNLNLLPIGGSTQTVQFSCGTAPANINCSFSPASITLDGTNVATVKITVNTLTTTAGLVRHSRALGFTATFAFAALFLPFGVSRRRKTILLGLLGIAMVTLFSAGCGSSSRPPVAQNSVYVLNVTATSSGTTAKTTPLVITVTH
jgi:pro-kumamolisin-like protein/Big-like domain-containing protein